MIATSSQAAKVIGEGQGEFVLSARLRFVPPHCTKACGGIARQIADGVAVAHGVTLADLFGKRGPAPLSRARQEAYWRLRQTGLYSYPAIGHMFGGRDHTTVLHGVRKHAERLAKGVG